MFRRYVAIGDSTTEGLEDPDGQGGYRGWANRFAEHLIAERERLFQRERFFNDGKQFIVGDDDERIHFFFEFGEAALRYLSALHPFK